MIKKACNIFIICLAFFSTSNAFGAAQSVIPFREKFRRQQNASTIEDGLFKPGEKVSGVFHINCDAGLARLVVNESLGGVGDIRHADSFHLNIGEEVLAELYSSQGIPITGVVEVIRAHNKDYIISNMFDYDAQLLFFRNAGPTNPSQQEIRQLEEGAPVVVEGVIASLQLGENGRMSLRTADGSIIDTVLTYGDIQYDGEIHTGLENIYRKKPEVFERVRMKGTVRKGQIHISSVRAGYLLKPGENRIREYRALRKQNLDLLLKLEAVIEAGNFLEAAKISSTLVKTERTLGEINVQAELISRMPPSDQPIVWKSRYEVDSLNKKLGIDLDQMTMAQFLAYLEAWADRRVFGSEQTEFKEPEVDGGYFFRLLEIIQAPRDFYSRLAMKVIEARLNFMEEHLKAGRSGRENIDFYTEYNFEQGLASLTIQPTVDSMNFLINTVSRVLQIESELRARGEERSRGLVLYKVFDTLKHASLRVNNGKYVPSDLIPAIKAVFTSRLAEIKTMREALLKIGFNPDIGRRPALTVVVIGMPAPEPKEDLYGDNDYGSELEALDTVIAKIKADWKKPTNPMSIN